MHHRRGPGVGVYYWSRWLNIHTRSVSVSHLASFCGQVRPEADVSASFRGRLIPPKGQLTAYTGWALSSVGLTTLQSSVLAWLSHTQHLSTMSLMGVSGGTLSRCRCKALFVWPAMNWSQIIRVLAFGPISPKTFQTDVGSPLSVQESHNGQWVLRPSRSAWLVLLLAPREPHSARLPQSGTELQGDCGVVPPIWSNYGIKYLSILVPTGRSAELKDFRGRKRCQRAGGITHTHLYYRCVSILTSSHTSSLFKTQHRTATPHSSAHVLWPKCRKRHDNQSRHHAPARQLPPRQITPGDTIVQRNSVERGFVVFTNVYGGFIFTDPSWIRIRRVPDWHSGKNM